MNDKKKGSSLAETMAAFKTLLTRNSILVILLPVANQIVVNLKNGWRSIYIMNDCGESATVLGVLMSFLLIVALISRTPLGVLTDKYRHKIKPFIGMILLAKAFVPYVYDKNPTLIPLISSINGSFFLLL